MSLYRAGALAVLMVLCSAPLLAQDSGGELEELSQEVANPIADLISVPFQNNTDFGLGPNDRAANVLNIQPVIPFFGGRILTRTIIPLV